jgi:DHA1 family tetracycline resistance protein-like MFS transporter
MRKNPLPVLFSMVLLDQIAVWMLLPILPLLLVEPNSSFFLLSSAAQVESVGYILLGLIFGTFPLMQFISSPILGEVSDKYGRKPAIMFSAFCLTIGYLLFVIGVLIKFIPLLFLARVLSGIGGGSLGVIFASASDISSEKNRTKNFSIIAAASGLGLILGPLLGGILSDNSISSFFNVLIPLYALAILALGNLVVVSIYFSETLERPDKTRTIKWNKPLTYVKGAYHSVQMRSIFLVSFIFSVSLALFVSFGPVLIYDRFSLSESSLSYFLAYFGFWIIITQILLVARLSRSLGKVKTLQLGLTCIFTGLLVLYLAPIWIWMLLAAPLIAFGVALSYTTITSLLSIETSKEKQGEVLGINASVQSLAFALPGTISGLIATQLTISAPIILAGIIVLCGIYVTIKSKSFRYLN